MKPSLVTKVSPSERSQLDVEAVVDAPRTESKVMIKKHIAYTFALPHYGSAARENNSSKVLNKVLRF
jgi:hypothetical protein